MTFKVILNSDRDEKCRSSNLGYSVRSNNSNIFTNWVKICGRPTSKNY